jgi:broad specificity phosphatase PhoE
VPAGLASGRARPHYFPAVHCRYTRGMEASLVQSSVDSLFFSSLKHETHFYILRHGQSEGNAKRIFQGSLDLPLDDVGRAQARAAGRWLAKRGVGAILSSPLARAAETARIAGAACGLGEVAYDQDFAELDVGIFTGLSYEESRERYPAMFRAFQLESWDAVAGAEKSTDLYERALRAWSILRDTALAGEKGLAGGEASLACVSHGGFIQWLVRATFGCRSWMPLLHTANCGVFELLVKPSEGGSAYLQWRRLNYQAPSD